MANLYGVSAYQQTNSTWNNTRTNNTKTDRKNAEKTDVQKTETDSVKTTTTQPIRRVLSSLQRRTDMGR